MTSAGSRSASKLTVSDWLTRAYRATDRADIARDIANAEMIARAWGQWRAISQAYRERLGDAAAAVRCLESAVAAEPTQIAAYGSLAEVLIDDRHDRAGALAVLARAEVVLTIRVAEPIYQWRLLAERWRDAADETGVRRCLDAGRARSAEVADYCDIAKGYAGLLDEPDTARELLARAEQLAETAGRGHGGRTDGGVHGWWTIANTYKGDLRDAGGARRSLERGLALALDVQGCITIAKAWTSHRTDELSVTHRCLRKAETLAQSAAEWIDTAQAYWENAADRDGAQRCLERARPLADSEESRQIAHGYRYWLDDVAAADALAPRGSAPADVAPKQRDLASWRSDAAGLLDWLRARVTPQILRSIARADHGYGEDHNYACLLDVCETGLVPVPFESTPHEVLALTRWSEGEHTDHVQRAFACTLMCIDVFHLDSFTEDVTSTIPPLVESCAELGREALDHLAGMLVWMVEASEPDDEHADLLAAMFGLVLARAAVAPHDPRLVDLVREVIDAEARLEAHTHWKEPARGWLLRVLMSLRDDMWRRLTARFLDEPCGGGGLDHLDEVRGRMQVPG